MNRSTGQAIRLLMAAGVLAFAGAAQATDVTVTLAGANEVPPVASSASASGKFSVADDGTVSGSITTNGIAATAAHIHEGAAGKNGGVVIPLSKDGDVFKVPEGSKLNEAQLASFKAGNLYVNVHSAANPKGELRAQLH
jgi:hypothetical protein